ncbi:MAG TPA: hypothetical protein VGD06_06415 [Acidobacteriota bacterium]
MDRRRLAGILVIAISSAGAVGCGTSADGGAAVGGGVWVVRPGPATQDPDCDEADFEIDGEAHCWPQERIIDAFDADGRYLGEVNVPAELRFEPLPFIRGNDVIVLTEDEAGTIRVKRYRLVPFGESLEQAP